MVEPLRLIAADVARKAIEAFENKSLGLCHVDTIMEAGLDRRCRYAYPPQSVGGRSGVGCGIGVSLPPELAAKFDRYVGNSSISHLIAKGLIETDQPKVLGTIQLLHDACFDLSAVERGASIRAFVAYCGGVVDASGEKA